MRTEVLEERFDTSTLDDGVWLPHYLPAWSSRALSRASFGLGGGLRLNVPVDHPLWCSGEHFPPLRVSGLQSGSWSGPAGSTRGQQRFLEGQVVREEQPRFEGWLMSSGRVDIRARMTLSARSMAALWMSGFEDDPGQEQCGELCVFEIFGSSVHRDPPSAEVGVGIKPFRDPGLADDFAAPRLSIDVSQPHHFAVRWDAREAEFTVDDEIVRICPRPPTYPLQLMLAVFDFPQWSTGTDDHLVPELVVDHLLAARG
ncbi:MAG TPA: glycoside hydrolase family 16 protein [Ornithinibacter sp.]|nr:glycoside hydrolase family 16 protein [Ornithinibacter sp.]